MVTVVTRTIKKIIDRLEHVFSTEMLGEKKLIINSSGIFFIHGHFMVTHNSPAAQNVWGWLTGCLHDRKRSKDVWPHVDWDVHSAPTYLLTVVMVAINHKNSYGSEHIHKHDVSHNFKNLPPFSGLQTDCVKYKTTQQLLKEFERNWAIWYLYSRVF